jgi:Zn-finger nucleic acid-binding protein
MARCNSCSAPLAANSNLCVYCGVRSDVDLRGKHEYQIQTQTSDRICPVCQKAMETIALKLPEPFYIERCKTCFGLFFDPGEIETLLQSSVSSVFNINLQHLENINRDRYQKQQKVQYRPCPVCQVLMNRVNFGKRSGVVVDQCRAHGIWLDSGEITHLMEWKKAGGQILDQQEQEKPKSRPKKRETLSSDSFADPYMTTSWRKQPQTLEEQLLDSVSELIGRLFM